jgi:ribosomal subunit interface protein
MKIIIKTKDLELAGDLQGFVEKKIGSIKKFIDILKQDTPERGKTLAEIFVEVEKETEHHRKGQIFSCQLEVRLPGKSLIVKSHGDDIYKSIVNARKELKQEIEKYKFKNISKDRRQQRKTKREA